MGEARDNTDGARGELSPGRRAMWLDVARGACVIAVVMLHVRIFVYDPLTLPTAGTEFWRQFTEFFGPFRLPLLFAISGLLVSKRVRNGWRDRRNLVRVASSYWIYLVWLGVFGVMSAVVTVSGVPFKISSPHDFVRQLLLPDTTLWFVFALALYVVVFTSLQRVPRPVIIGIFAVVAVLSGLAPASLAEEQWLHIIYFAVFFAAGVYLPAALVWFSQGRIAVKLLLTLGAFVLLQLLWQLTEAGDVVETSARLLRDSAAVTLAIGVCALASRAPGVVRPLARVGQRTLPIYILQLPVIWALYLLPIVPPLYEIPVVRYLGPVFGTVIVVAVSLLVFWLMDRTRLRYLFRLPRTVSDRIVRARQPVSARGAAG
ncbi:acyltransferase [Herbiconiux sp. CPCC 205763]|uniref:Acyltransferase n=1 Tax=Herbiconiux aconitum TaxID=2970913 RepID=A0ABT2GS23_9MICO|nr:acyltransferase [Herbiconiux aconitum]MCS5718367.1 acyltransferase [Herbiconiux aconitum]